MKKTLLFITLLVPSLLFAESTPTSDNDTFKVRMGGYLMARNDTVLTATTPYLVGAKVNLQDDLGMEAQTRSFRFDGHYRFTDNHMVEFSYYNIRTGNSKTLEKELNFNGKTFQAGTKVEAHLDLNIYKLNYAYSFYHSDKVELAWAAGLHMMGTKMGIKGNAFVNNNNNEFANETAKFLAPLPVFGFRVNYAVTPRFQVNGTIDYFGISYDDYKGNLSDILITAEYQLFENWSTGIGVNMTSLDLEINDDKMIYEAQQNLTGVLLYVGYNF